MSQGINGRPSSRARRCNRTAARRAADKAEHVPTPMDLGFPDPKRWVHPEQSWGRGCAHYPRGNGLTVVPRLPCPACIDAGDAAEIVGERPGFGEYGTFRTLRFKGGTYVQCTNCWTVGKVDWEHQCRDRSKNQEPRGNWKASLYELRGEQAPAKMPKPSERPPGWCLANGHQPVTQYSPPDYKVGVVLCQTCGVKDPPKIERF